MYTKIKHLNVLKIALIPIALLLLNIMGCKSDGTKKESEVSLNSKELNEDIFKDVNDAKKIFYSLPSPLETAMLIKNSGAKYNEEFLNPINKASGYTTNKSMALNLGVYTTDLSFASLFDQTQTAINYMTVAKKMADGLGILDAIDNKTIDKLEENINNRDVIMDIISETFMSSSSFLRENDRPAIAAIVLVGGWVEGLYIATQLVGSSPIQNNKMVDRIVDQKLSLDIVMRLLNDNKNNSDVVAVQSQIKEIKSIYDKIKISSTKIEPVSDPKTKVTTLKSKTKVFITQDIFNQLREKVKAVRTNFTL
jgi:hypothetical protein